MLFFDIVFSFNVSCPRLHSLSVNIYRILFNDSQALQSVDYSTLLNSFPNNGLTYELTAGYFD